MPSLKTAINNSNNFYSVTHRGLYDDDDDDEGICRARLNSPQTRTHSHGGIVLRFGVRLSVSVPLSQAGKVNYSNA